MSAEEQLLERTRAAVAGCEAALEASAQRINDLNVYPVPDGDTGTNLSLTLRAVSEAMARQEPAPAGALARAVARAALMGARGNSGIILSQVVRGLCDGLEGARHFDGGAVAASLRAASDAAYRAVRQPVEGTMLTVIREMAEGAEAAAVPGAGADAVLDAALAQGADALERTPGMLQVLADAGVVDAGGAGLVELLRGAIAGLRGEELPRVAAPAPTLSLEAVHAGETAFRYCTSFLVEGAALDAVALEASLQRFGDCVLVVGDRDALKVHVHTDDPGGVLQLGTALGGVAAVDVADMRRQAADRSARLGGELALVQGGSDRACDVVCVVAGEGNAALVRDLGARGVVEGGQTMNPSTQDLVDAIAACGGREVVLLPNNGNVVLAAEQAALAADRPARVVETRSIAAGLAAMVAYDPTADAERNAVAMAAAAAGVRCGEVTVAVRDAQVDGVAVRAGDYLSLLDGTVVGAHRDAAAALQAVADALLADGGDVLTVLRGAGGDALGPALEELLAGVAAAHPELEIAAYEGGQPHYPVLLSVE